jgi:hypothetical protein
LVVPRKNVRMVADTYLEAIRELGVYVPFIIGPT